MSRKTVIASVLIFPFFIGISNDAFAQEEGTQCTYRNKPVVCNPFFTKYADGEANFQLRCDSKVQSSCHDVNLYCSISTDPISKGEAVSYWIKTHHLGFAGAKKTGIFQSSELEFTISGTPSKEPNLLFEIVTWGGTKPYKLVVHCSPGK